MWEEGSLEYINWHICVTLALVTIRGPNPPTNKTNRYRFLLWISISRKRRNMANMGYRGLIYIVFSISISISTSFYRYRYRYPSFIDIDIDIQVLSISISKFYRYRYRYPSFIDIDIQVLSISIIQVLSISIIHIFFFSQYQYRERIQSGKAFPSIPPRLAQAHNMYVFVSTQRFLASLHFYFKHCSLS